MFSLLWLALFGLVVGVVAKAIHPGDEPVGCLPTIMVGVGGSFVGGAANWILGFGGQPFERSGFLMSILGGVVCCAVWRWYSLKYSDSGPKSFLTGKYLKD